MTTVLAFDIFGTTVDWHTGVAEQVSVLAAKNGIELDAGEFASAWRERYLPSMDLVRHEKQPWCNLDVLHFRSLSEMLNERGIELDEFARAEFVQAWYRLPAWPDVMAGLTELRRDYLLAAVSNGGFALLTTLINAAQLPFDCIVSAEMAGHYKPDPEVYLTLTALLAVPPDEVLMVACHNWDLAGARAAGLRTAFVERPLEKGPNGRADQPGEVEVDLIASSFTDLASKLGDLRTGV